MANVDPLSHTLGRIEQSLETITKTLSEDRMASAQYRTEVRRDLSAVRDMVHDLKNRVNNTADDLAELRPDVEDLKKTKQQGIGGWNLVKTIWAVVLALGAGGIGAILTALGLNRPPHP